MVHAVVCSKFYLLLRETVIYRRATNALINNNHLDVVLLLIDFNIIHLCYSVYVTDDTSTYHII